MRRTCLLSAWVLLIAFVAAPRVTAAQTTDPQPPQSAAPPEPERNDPDIVVDPMQPDFNLTALPTSLRMPAGRWAFRVTHRFTRDLGDGDFGDLASDLFGLDAGAQIGLEVRYGLLRGTQVGIHRTSDKTIQLFGQHNIFSERPTSLDAPSDSGGRPFGMDVIATFEGWDNLSEQHQGSVGIVLSKNIGRLAAGYVEPIVALNANPAEAGDDHTLMIGVGGRFRVTRTTYLMGEWIPRVAGYTAFADQVTFGLETRAGGHLFQINVGNGFGTTLGQVAQGTGDYERWYLGFSIARKFF